MVKKEQFRAKCRQFRKNLSDKVYQNLSENIINRLTSELNVTDYKVVHCYAAIQEKREINTLGFLKFLLDNNQTVAVPRADFDTMEMNHFQITDITQLKKNYWGIPEPGNGTSLPPEKFDLIIVPMLGGDINCHRIGYGKGFYDRFLNKTNGFKAGLCYDACISEEPMEQQNHDVTLDIIITENRICLPPQ